MDRKIRLGIFTLLGLAFIVGMSIFVNDKPFWYRACNNVVITVDDATGLRRKSAVKTLGLDIGYINAVSLDGEKVLLDVCITSPVKLRPDTKAYLRSSGFLGDRFLELKPLDATPSGELQNQKIKKRNRIPAASEKEQSFWNFLIPSAQAQSKIRKNKVLSASREMRLSDTLGKVGKLLDELSFLVGDLRKVTSKIDFDRMGKNLNRASKDLAEMLGGKGGIKRNLTISVKALKNSMRQLERILRKMNSNKGNIGKLVNEEGLYEEAVAALKSLNELLGKAGRLQLFVDLSAWQVNAYGGAKSRIFFNIQPHPDRYYLLGLSTDVRGRKKRTTTTTVVDGGQATVKEEVVNKESGLKITAVLGRYFGPLDLRVGLLEDAGMLGAGFWWDEERRYGVHGELYGESSKEGSLSFRIYARAQVFMSAYVIAGVDDLREYEGSIPFFFGAGIHFNDQDIKFLFSLL